MADSWMAVNWLIWAMLWLLYFLLLGLNRPIQRQTACFTLLTGVFTGWLPGFLMIEGVI